MARSIWTLMNWLPIREVHQVLFAEAFSQAIDSGMEMSSAILAASQTSRSRRFRHALHVMGVNCRQGYTLSISLSKSGVRTARQFRAALEVGETRGHLAEELSAFARYRDQQAPSRLAASLGRSTNVTQFAAALARLLVNERLTVTVIADASRLAAGKDSGFDRVIGCVIEDMRNGESLAEALRRHPRVFDIFLCKLIAAPQGRDVLRKTLARACGESTASVQTGEPAGR